MIGPLLRTFLEDLERRIDPAVEAALLDEWNSFVEGDFGGEVFSPKRRASSPPGVEWPEVTVNAAAEDREAMALRQYGLCSGNLAEGDGRLMNVRADYGTSILPSVFGVKLFFMDEEANTLPTSWPLEGGIDAVRRVVESGVPENLGSLAGRALEMGTVFAEIGREYPKIGRYVHVYHPDTQGPMDICEVLRGSDLFVDVVEEPDLVRAFNEVISDLYIAFLRKWYAIIPPEWPDRSVHYGCLHGGRVMLRNDSATNFSPAMYRDFILPYDRKVLNEFGGGAVHFCGRGDHFIEDLTSIEGLKAVNMTQAHLNDMERIFRNTVDRGVNLIGDAGVARAAASLGRPTRGRIHRYDSDRPISG